MNFTLKVEFIILLYDFIYINYNKIFTTKNHSDIILSNEN